ncbi:cellulase family glycosylhydrolase [Mycobacterium sp. 94-17]|uniref:cellulase family glycosylhydrolase n=1 Tax=Mycobacterium sp. 94-17 TaxID=2986147 RepID=UPI002D1EB2DB|nr:cellulase family glycosylhydrolase [Mycobacterium sp. 94-17]MEB4210077.1 cellulase family glycosylhydrolase [Mycobacterium sp. 94-17]
MMAATKFGRRGMRALTIGAKRSLVILLIVTVLWSMSAFWRTKGQQIPQPTFTGYAGNHLRVGISFGNTLPSMTDDELAVALDDVVETGARWIRFDMPWIDIQPTSAQRYVWGPFDRIIAQAQRRKIGVLPIISYTPPWARTAGCSSMFCAPRDPAEFAAFAGAAAKRYSPRGAHYWEVWNEPNYSHFWQPSPDPAAYTRLLKAASATIRQADPHAFVVMGGLGTAETGVAGNISISDFLSAPAESPLRLVDALAVHPYTYPNPASRGPWADPSLPDDSGLPYLRRVLAKAGTPHLPIWITEYGAPTGGAGPAWGGSDDSLAAEPDHVTEVQQAVLAKDAIATARSEPMIGSLFWYTYRDVASPADSVESHFGITRVDGSKKPVFAALADAVKGLIQ